MGIIGSLIGIIINLISIGISAVILLIIIRAILSWLPEVRAQNSQATALLDRVTDPFIRPFQRIIPLSSTGGMDMSPVLAIVALSILRTILLIIQRMIVQ